MKLASATTANLPVPDERPGSDAVIYDGRCDFCRSQVEKLLRWDCQDKLSYVSLHDPRVAQWCPELSPEQLMREMVIVDRHGRRHMGPFAVRYLTRRLRRLWWLAPLLHLPGSMLLWTPLYRWIARNRYRLSGRAVCEGGTCESFRSTPFEPGTRT